MTQETTQPLYGGQLLILNHKNKIIQVFFSHKSEKNEKSFYDVKGNLYSYSQIKYL